MGNLIRLVRNENMKIYKRVGTWVMIGLLFVAVLGIGIFSKFIFTVDDQEDWKAQLQAENSQLEQSMTDNPMLEVGNSYVMQQIALNQYRIDHDIPPVESNTLWGVMTDATNFTGIAALFTIVIAAGIVSNEFSWGTVKLLLIRPVSRSKVLLAKYMSTLLFACFMLVTLFVASFLIGVLFFGMSGAEYPYLAYQDGQVVEQSMITHIITLFGLQSVNLIMMVTFAFMISTVFRSSSLAIGISLFLMFTGPQIVQLLSKYEWSKYILFANTNLSQYIDGIPLVEGMTMKFSISVLLVYFMMFTVLSWVIFKKRDVSA